MQRVGIAKRVWSDRMCRGGTQRISVGKLARPVKKLHLLVVPGWCSGCWCDKALTRRCTILGSRQRDETRLGFHITIETKTTKYDWKDRQTDSFVYYYLSSSFRNCTTLVFDSLQRFKTTVWVKSMPDGLVYFGSSGWRSRQNPSFSTRENDLIRVEISLSWDHLLIFLHFLPCSVPVLYSLM